MLKKLKKNYFLLISTFFIFYFFFNFMSGERGFISYLEKKDILKDLQLKEASLIKNIEDKQDIYIYTPIAIFIS